MQVVIRSGGKQYNVEKGSVVKVERTPGDVGSMIVFGDVLLFVDESGNVSHNPSGVKVEAKVLEQKKDKKVIIFKKKRRKNYRRKNGHRQFVTVLKISGIITS